jgi:uncharacterized membrane protein
MNVDQKLRLWREAGLIDEATSARIASFEHTQRKPLGMYAVIGLGASTIGLGLVSLVAANWEVIPAALKLAVDLALGVALAVSIELATLRQWRQSQMLREALVTIFYGYTLASLALVGQVYQLNAPTYQALLTWSLATLPLWLLGESLFLGVLYTAGLATAHGFGLDALFDALQAGVGEAAGRNIAACAVFVSPLAYVLLGFVPWLVTQRPNYAWSMRAGGSAAVLLGGFMIPMFWYSDLSPDDTLSWSLVLTLIAAVSFSAIVGRLLSIQAPRTRLGLQCIVPAAWLLLVLSAGFAHGEAEYIAGLLQIAWLALCAFVSYRALWLRLFNWLTALLALRILAVYFEVFGSLLDTGVGLVTGGALTLLISWWWQRKTRQLAARARAQTGAPHVA